MGDNTGGIIGERGVFRMKIQIHAVRQVASDFHEAIRHIHIARQVNRGPRRENRGGRHGREEDGGSLDGGSCERRDIDS